MASLQHDGERVNGDVWPAGYDPECDGYTWEPGPDPDDLQWWAEHAPSNAGDDQGDDNAAEPWHGMSAGLAMAAGWPDAHEAERIRLGILPRALADVISRTRNDAGLD
jgi:hypothetical protein